MRTAPLLAFTVTLACSKAPLPTSSLVDETADQPRRDVSARRRPTSSLVDETADQATCDVVANAPELVLSVQRHVLSELAGVGDYVERGDVTVNGTCTSKTCRRISAAAMSNLVARLHAMGTIHHQAERSVSPHYGFRRIEARWSGGECAFTDGVHGMIEERDHDKFYAVFDAIGDVYVKAEAAHDAGTSPSQQ